MRAGCCHGCCQSPVVTPTTYWRGDLWSGRGDSNSRPHGPEPCTLTWLSYFPRRRSLAPAPVEPRWHSTDNEPSVREGRSDPAPRSGSAQRRLGAARRRRRPPCTDGASSTPQSPPAAPAGRAPRRHRPARRHRAGVLDTWVFMVNFLRHFGTDREAYALAHKAVMGLPFP
jgi:hypothetical protein